MEACVDQPAHGADRVSAQFPAASLHMQPEGLGRPRPLKASAPAPPLGVWPHLQPPFSDTPPPDPGQMHLPWRLEMLLLQALLDN